MKLLGMAVAMSAFVMTQAQETPPPADLMKQAQTLADTRIENFRNAINDPVARRTAFLEMQADPIAVSRLNVKDAAKNPIHEDLIQAANAESTAIREPVKARLKAEVAAKYGVSPDAVQTVEYGKTPRSNPREFGQDWDLTARVNGRNVPAPVAQKIAHQAYLDSATTVEGVNGAVKITVTDPKTGEARSITADEFTHRQSLAVTDPQHPDAYAGGKTGGKAVNDIAAVDPETGLRKLDPGTRLRDPTQLSQAIEFKSNEAAERAEKLEKRKVGGEVDAQSWRLEQVRQSTKQFDKLVQPMVEANGGRVPETLKDGMDVLKQVSSGEISPAQAEARLKAMGEVRGGQPESIQSIIQKNAQLVEAAQVLKPPGERGAAIDRNDFVESVRDRLANKGIDLDPDTPRNLENARRPVPKTPEEVAEAAKDLRDSRKKLIDDVRNNDLLDKKTRNELADNIEARDAEAAKPKTEPKAEPKPEARGEADGPRAAGEGTPGKLRAGMRVLGEGMMISDGLNFAQDLVDVQQGKKSGKEVAANLGDIATLGVWGITTSLTQKALDRADAKAIVQAATDATWLVETGKALRDAKVSSQDVIAIMKSLAQGDESLLQKKLAELKENGISVKLPERQIASVEGDEGVWDRTKDVGKGFADKFLRAGTFLLNTGKNVVEIPWDSINTIMKSIQADQQLLEVKDQKERLIAALVARGADRDQAFAAVSIFLDSGGKDREILDRMRFELAVLEAHPELRKLSPEELDRALYRLHEQYLAAKNAPPKDKTADAAKSKEQSDAEKLAKAATKAEQANRNLAGFLDQLAAARAKETPMVEVPNVVGSDPDSASKTIKAANFVPAPVPLKRMSDSVVSNVVQDQEPKAGSLRAAGSSVEFYFIAGKPSTKTVTVPSLVGLTKEDAEKKLTEAKLTAKPKAGDRKPNRSNKRREVYSQVPAAKSEVKEGDAVNFEYLAGIKVDRYIGMKKDEAEAAIKKDGLKPNVQEGDLMAKTAAERAKVYEQKPQPNEYLWFDEAVDAEYYKFAEGFQKEDGGRVDGRFSEAVISDGEVPGIKGGSAGKNSAIYFYPKGAGQGGKENRQQIGWMIKRFGDAAGAKAYLGDQVKTTMPEIKAPAGFQIERTVGGSDASYFTSFKTAVSEGSMIRRVAVHRDFVILYSHIEPTAGFNFAGESARIFKKSIEIITERFPPE